MRERVETLQLLEDKDEDSTGTAWAQGTGKQVVAARQVAVGAGREQVEIFTPSIQLDFDQRKLKISHKNLRFGQNESCRGGQDLQY